MVNGDVNIVCISSFGPEDILLKIGYSCLCGTRFFDVETISFDVPKFPIESLKL